MAAVHASAPAAPVARAVDAGRLVFLTRRLTYGGAERQLVLLASALRRRGCDVHVAVMYGDGELEDDLARADVPVHVLGKRGRWDVAGFGVRLARLLRALRPAVLHGYLPVDNLLVAAAAPLLPGTRCIWGVRASDIDHTRYDWLARVTSRLEAHLSRRADLIIANSEAGRAHALRLGFAGRRMIVIPNGIDTDRFAPDPAARTRVRAEWGIGAGEVLVGIVGRLDPMKDHPTFLSAAARVAAARGDVRFVAVGRGPEAYAATLQAEATRLGLDGRLRWAGARHDTAAVYAALDVLVSSSAWGEGFSNVLAEGLACGVPVVATDVGDARTVVGGSGLIVPAGDAAALADGVLAVLDRRSTYAADARRGIVERFGVDRLASRFLEAAWPRG